MSGRDGYHEQRRRGRGIQSSAIEHLSDHVEEEHPYGSPVRVPPQAPAALSFINYAYP